MSAVSVSFLSNPKCGRAVAKVSQSAVREEDERPPGGYHRAASRAHHTRVHAEDMVSLVLSPTLLSKEVYIRSLKP